MKASRARRAARRRRMRALRAMRYHSYQVLRHGRFVTPHGDITIHEIPKREKVQ